MARCGRISDIGARTYVHRPLVSDDGRRLAVGTRQGPILVWDDFRKSTSRRTLRGHQRYVWDICFSPDDQRVASAACDGSVRLWNVNTGNELLFFPTAANWNYAVAFSHNGQTLAFGGGKGIAAGTIQFVRADR